MSLNVSEKSTTIIEKLKPDPGRSGLLGGPAKTIRSEPILPILPERPNFYNRSVPMRTRYIKFIPSPHATWLRDTHPFAFLLLNLIAEKACRVSGGLDGREVGEAILSNYKSIGGSRQQYRTALQILVRLKLVRILAHSRKRKKSTTESTTDSTSVPTTQYTHVKLLDSSIWDINPEDDNHLNDHPINHSINQSATTEQPLIPLTATYSKEDKKIRIFSSDSDEFGLAVFLFQKVKEFVSSAKDPNFQKWAKEFDLMIRLDKRAAVDVRNMIDWLFTSGPLFWRKNILSPAKLREQWTRLQAEQQTCKTAPKQTVREKILKNFTHGQFYSQAECFIDDYSIAFHRGMNHKQIKFSEHGFWDQFQNVLREFSITMQEK